MSRCRTCRRTNCGSPSAPREPLERRCPHRRQCSRSPGPVAAPISHNYSSFTICSSRLCCVFRRWGHRRSVGIRDAIRQYAQSQMPETILFDCEALCITAAPVGERIAAALQHRASLWSVDVPIGRKRAGKDGSSLKDGNRCTHSAPREPLERRCSHRRQCSRSPCPVAVTISHNNLHSQFVLHDCVVCSADEDIGAP
jgi:hypothetical protein